MVTLTFKAPARLKTRLARAARARKVSVSALIRTSVEKELPEKTRGSLLGAGAQYSLGPSTYDPEAPAFPENEWEQL
jgi:hypothetical protein